MRTPGPQSCNHVSTWRRAAREQDTKHLAPTSYLVGICRQEVANEPAAFLPRLRVVDVSEHFQHRWHNARQDADVCVLPPLRTYQLAEGLERRNPDVLRELLRLTQHHVAWGGMECGKKSVCAPVYLPADHTVNTVVRSGYRPQETKSHSRIQHCVIPTAEPPNGAARPHTHYIPRIPHPLTLH